MKTIKTTTMLKKISFKKSFLVMWFSLLPFVSFAQFESNNATDLVNSISKFINKMLMPIVVLLGLVYVIYGVVEYIRDAGDSTEKEDQKKKIFWGIIGLFVILSVWALVFVIANTFDLKPGGVLK